MNRDKIETQTMLYTKTYVDVHSPNLVSVHFYAIPILHFKFPIYLPHYELSHWLRKALA